MRSEFENSKINWLLLEKLYCKASLKLYELTFFVSLKAQYIFIWHVDETIRSQHDVSHYFLRCNCKALSTLQNN